MMNGVGGWVNQTTEAKIIASVCLALSNAYTLSPGPPL
jgi:hypothetical protein